MSHKLLRGFNLIIVFCLFVASLVVIAVSSVTTIYYDMGSDVDFPHYGKENVLLLLLFLLISLVVFYLMYRGKIFEKDRLLIVIALLFIGLYCMMLILSINPQAVNDSKTLDDIINQFARGDYSSLTTPGEYLFTWPFQLGYVGFGQMMHAIFGESNYFAWDMVQLLSILVTIYLLYQITWELFEDEVICGIMAILSFGALFFYNYVTYIYGDIISMAPQTLALYLMIKFTKIEKLGYFLGATLSIAVAVLLKTNCEITLIALAVILMHGVIEGRSKYKNVEINVADTKKKPNVRPAARLVQRLVLSIVMVSVTILFKTVVDSHYCRLTGMDSIPDGNPAWAHIAMGLQESPLEDGWYNGYNYQVFSENGFDSAATGQAAIENIKGTLSDFAHRPLHGARFFIRKFTTQWADPVCVSTHNLDLVSRHVDKESALRDFLVFGSDRGCPMLIWIMNIFMPVCYIGALVYLFGILRGREVSHHEMLILILIFGGILFHEFWEGSSRYAMRYYIYWLPYAAFGMKKVLEKADTMLGRIVRS